MSTNDRRRSARPSAAAPATRRRARSRRGLRRFGISLSVVLVSLAAVGLAGAVATIVSGPRITDVQVNPAAAAQASGARLIVTTSLPLEQVQVEQVQVEPATEFAVDTAGRSVGVRFARPLWDDTEYTVTFSDVRGIGASNTATFSESFRTPAAEVFLLQRGGSSDDTIVRTDLVGAELEPIFKNQHIEDFRATNRYLVISVRDDNDQAALIVTDLDGQNPRELSLPGDGFVTHLQSADRGDRIGYTFTDRELDETTGRESRLFTASLDRPEADPTPIELTGADPRVAEWRFVPDTDSILLLSFDGTLLLTDAVGEQATALGAARAIDSIARGSTDALVERVEGRVVIDLSDASATPLVAPDASLGPVGEVTALPGGGTIRLAADLDATGTPTGGTSVALVAVDGSTRPLLAVAQTDAVLQICPAPSARYAAVLVAPDVATNRYDTYVLPIPGVVQTRIIEIDSGDQVGTLPGFDISWCRLPPSQS